MIDLTQLTTEARNPNTFNLDELSAAEIVAAMNREDGNAVEAVKEQLPVIARLAEACTQTLQNNGRIIYIGAGTSGRLGVLDAVECPPTFGVDSNTVIGMIAGGDHAFVKAMEGAEDSLTLAEQELRHLNATDKDIVIGIAASGRTPYVIGGLRYAKKIGCKTGSISCNANAAISLECDIPIEVVTGPEVLTGSTRLKAGSAQKMILNMLSTASMIGSGKVYENLMVDVAQTNKKLVTRAENIVMTAAGCSRETARTSLEEAGGSAKLAITSLLMNIDNQTAKKELTAAQGHVKRALQHAKKQNNI